MLFYIRFIFKFEIYVFRAITLHLFESSVTR